jgi:hypothetical protein
MLLNDWFDATRTGGISKIIYLDIKYFSGLKLSGESRGISSLDFNELLFRK